MFTEANIHEIQNKGIQVEKVEKQIKRFETGFPSINIAAAATLENGFLKIDEKEAMKYSRFFDKKKRRRKIVKFVPASGAASRMFKMLFTLLAEYDETEESYKKLFTDKGGIHSPKGFIENITKFAFYEDLKQSLSAANLSIDELLAGKKYRTILEFLLTEKGLNYGNLPKGLLQFHLYPTQVRTALEEHLVEGAAYSRNYNNDVNIHFTVSPEFIAGFKSKVQEVKYSLQNEFSVKYYVDYSVQKATTDTIAVTSDNKPFLNSDGSLLFRPAGHGALIENLNELDYDIIFIKNIDNIVPDTYKPTTVLYKKTLAGILIQYQLQLFKYYEKIKKAKHLSDKRFGLVTKFFEQELHFVFPEGFKEWPRNDCKEYILDLLNRPIRVCGMVKNEGEPGGGPFFVVEKDGSKTLQIIEKAQINLKDARQVQILNESTHFNPVNLVCGIKDFEGKKFNLLDFVDEESGIITTKSKDGKDLKALELPGLWNGAMANWNTIFVEVPTITFNPVKEVTDLLRKEHQQ